MAKHVQERTTNSISEGWARFAIAAARAPIEVVLRTVECGRMDLPRGWARPLSLPKRELARSATAS